MLLSQDQERVHRTPTGTRVSTATQHAPQTSAPMQASSPIIEEQNKRINDIILRRGDTVVGTWRDLSREARIKFEAFIEVLDKYQSEEDKIVLNTIIGKHNVIMYR